MSRIKRVLRFAGGAVIVSWFVIVAILLFGTEVDAREIKQAGRIVTHSHHTEPGHQHGNYSIGLGIGAHDTAMVQLSSMQKEDRVKLFAILLGGDEDGDQFVVQERRTPQGTRFLPLQGDDGDTTNLCVGAAYLGYYEKVSGGIGAAYCADDDTANIDQRGQIYLEGMVETPGGWWIQKCGAWMLSDFSDDATFLGCAKNWR